MIRAPGLCFGLHWQSVLRVLATLGRAAALALFVGVPAFGQTSDYAGSGACGDCHADQSARWSGSDHAHAWTLPTDATVLGDFRNVTFSHGGVTTRFFRDGEKFMIETLGGDGQRRAFPVVGVVGIKPLQQYLLTPETGRTQTFDIAWDVDQSRWFPVFPDQAAPPGDGMHWTGTYKSWETRCAECHATGYTRNYSPVTRTFAPRMAETGVGCEACHGPGTAHINWAKNPDSPPVPGLTAKGLTVDLGAGQQAEVQQCLTCHSLREALADGNSVPGTPYGDAYALSLLRAGQYHPDGTILGEVFEGGSFLQSKMHAKGVRCSDCHEPHSGVLRAEGNGVCTQCHSPAGNSRFPTLPLRVFDGPEHHFHPNGSAGAQCVSCHMVERTYMGVDERRDHSFRVPRPDLAATGSPNACTDCHTDRTAAWAAAEIERRFPDSLHRGSHYASTFAAARIDAESKAESLLDVAEWDGPGIVRATALELLAGVARPEQADRLTNLLFDPDPLVRAAVAGTFGFLAPDERLNRLMPLLTDPMATVRIASARALLDVQADAGTPQAQAVSRAMAEWQASMASRLDFPETNMQLAGVGLTIRNWDMAQQGFAEAVAIDPQLVQGWVMLVRIKAALGDGAGAAKALAKGLAANPDDPFLLNAARESGIVPAP